MVRVAGPGRTLREEHDTLNRSNLTLATTPPGPRWLKAAMLSLIAWILPLSAGDAFAQFPDPLPDPAIDLRVAGNVLAMVRQPDGGVVFGGNFSQVDGEDRPSIARLRPDGSLDMTWNPGVNGSVSALAVDAGGAVFVGGDFSFIGGAPRLRLAKLSGSGTGQADPAWNPQADDSVMALAVDGAGSVYAGGRFGSIGGTVRSRIAKLMADGSGAPVAAWSPSPNAVVNALSWQDGALHLGGAFTAVDGLPRAGLARVDAGGTVDPAWNPGLDGTVFTLQAGPGVLYVGGSFTTVAGLPLPSLARISTLAAGAVDASWTPRPDGAVSALMLDGTSLTVGGAFTSIGGMPRVSLARLSTAAGAAADPGFDPRPDGTVRALAAVGNDAIAIGGLFMRVGNDLRLAVAVLQSDGNSRPAIDADSIGRVNSLLPLPDGSVIVGGYFQKADGLSRGHLLKLRPDGTLDPLWSPWANATVVALARAPDGDVLVGGHFTHLNDLPRGYLARLAASGTGELDPDWRPTAGRRVLAMSTTATALYVGGEFDRVDGVPRSRLAKLGFNGALDPAWNPGADAPVHALAATASDVYVGGDFSQVAGVARSRIARLAAVGEGTVDAAWNPGADARVLDLRPDPAGRVYVAGEFRNVAGVRQAALARLLGPAGAVDPDWNPLVDDGVPAPATVVRALSLSGQLLYAAGRFGAIGGLGHGNIARLSVADASADKEWIPLANGNVFDIDVTGRGRPVVGGDFIAVNGAPRHSLVMFDGDDTIFANGFQ